MYACPRCHNELLARKDSVGIYWECCHCGGRAAGIGYLRKNLDGKIIAQAWAEALETGGDAGCSCPMCSRQMAEVTVDASGHSLKLDLCRPCSFFWFDTAEYEALPAPPPKPHQLGEIDRSKMSPEARELLAMAEVRQIAEAARQEDSSPDADWKTIPALMGMPVELDTTIKPALPWATWGLSALIATISIAAFFDLDRIVDDYGFIPAEAWRDYGATFFTSFFLHVGPEHLISNLYFLLLFGPAVENHLGRARWLFLIFVATGAGDLFHLLGEPRGSIPCVGASGGISGVITFYALQFPHSRLGLLFYYRWIQFPAWTALLVWIGLQAWGAVQQMLGLSSVSAFAHLGGVAVGVALWFAWHTAKPVSRDPLQIEIS